VLVQGLLADERQIDAASPIVHVRGNRTPFYMTHGSRDLPEMIPQAKAMAAALAEQPGELRLEELPHYSHFDTSERCNHEAHQWVRTVREWMTR
jgi:arylformamidase